MVRRADARRWRPCSRALSLAIGACARSTKEGQYYLLPIFLGTMPLVLFSLAPGMELTLKTSLIPVTGLCLLLQRLIFPPAEAGRGYTSFRCCFRWRRALP